MRPESLYFLFSPITRIKGVGGATAKALENLLPQATVVSGATQPIVRDLLFHLPVGIVDRRFTCPLKEAPNGVIATFIVNVDEHLPPKRRGKSPYKVICSNETGDITLVFFHAGGDYLQKALPVGSKRVISGRVEHYDFQVQMPHPDIIAPVDQLADVQKTEAVYPLTLGITSRRIGKIVHDALEKLPVLPEWTSEKTIDFKTALVTAHNPTSEDDLSPASPARQRLAYDEIFANQLHLAILRQNMQRQPGEIIKGTGNLTDPLIKSLPFMLTGGQTKALAEIADDMASGHRMGRLLQGDVGSGKTIVALLSMLKAAEQQLQSALMVPTELIAQQHYDTISKLLGTEAHLVVLLTGSVKGKQREDILQNIANGTAKIIIGTHALFQEHVAFKNLAFVVIDEQHRFGVEQRMALTEKGAAPHILHMTATPIPRSLTMTLYGDMDISQLTEKPAGRQPITTRIIPSKRYGEVLERLKAALARGEKAYWICPLIEDTSEFLEKDLAAAKSRFTEFKARFGDKVGLVHGRMKSDERNEQMKKFADGKTTLLVATTVIEVGVDIKDATIMVVEQAERFGLAQLHQLRGRVGRGSTPSACVLLYNDVAGEEAKSRLSILRETDDGFKIADADLAQRGGGELLGTRQSGMPRFIFMNLFAHQELIARARDDAKAFLKNDPEFKTPRGQALKLLLQLFVYE